jgi:putative membrane protein
MFRRVTSLAAAGVAGLALLLLGPPPASAAEAVDEFARDAAIGGMAEVELGRLAVEKATNPDVKKFGQRMVDDHSKANDDLQKAAREQGIGLPTEIDSRHKAQIDDLSKLSGYAFDKAYMRAMVKDHEKDVAEFEKVSQESGNTAVQAFAAKALPTLQDHLKMAREVSRNLGP